MDRLAVIEDDLDKLYTALRDGECELKIAAELANIAGKKLKAQQLRFAREVFVSGRAEIKMIEADSTPTLSGASD